MSVYGVALSMLSRVAGSDVLDRLKARGLAEEVVRNGTRATFQTMTAVTSRFRPAKKGGDATRLPSPAPSSLFDLTPTEDQKMIRDTAARFAEETLRPAAEAADHACAAPAEVVAQAAELGLALYAIPEAHGGAGTESSPVTGALLAETLAHGDMGLATAILAPLGVVTAISRWGTAEQQATYLPAFAEGSGPAAAIALVEPRALFDAGRLRTRARLTPDGYVLDGVKSAVPLATTAELFLVAADLIGKGPQLFVVDRATPGVSVAAEPGMGLRAAALGRVTLEGVRLPASALLGGAVDACPYRDLVALARIGWCAQAVGAAQAVLDYVIPYCNERTAFGEPITNRQSVAFLIADIAIELEGMRMLTLRAASRAEQGLSFHREAHLARVQCAEKGMLIGTSGVQLLGGHGFVKDHPVERWYRDLRAIGVVEGGVLV